MAKRQIHDELGRIWDVWDVIPSDVLNSSYDRRSSDRARPSSARMQPSLQPELEEGWLCFQTASERRRFAPIPVGWFDFSQPDLGVVLEKATPVTAFSETPNQPTGTEPTATE
jgi:hypothetical protein